MGYTQEEKLSMFRSQCYDKAAILLAGALSGNKQDIVKISDVFAYAEKLYDEGVKRGWLSYGAIKQQEIMVGITATSSNLDLEDKGTLKDPITEKDNLGKKEKPEPELVI